MKKTSKKTVKNKPQLEKKDKIIRIVLLSIVVIASLLFSSFIVVSYLKSRVKEPEPQEVKIDDNIDSYGYILNDNATTYYKELFNKLKILLNTPDFEEVEYAKLVAQMFAADFYNLENKFTSSDIGGLSFVVKDVQVNFKLAAQNGMYNIVENNIYGDREQQLPGVTKVNVLDAKVVSHKYNNVEDKNAYQVTLELEYAEDLGYPTSVKVILIHSNDKLEIAKVW